MKRFLSVLLAVLLTVSCFATIAFAAGAANVAVSTSQEVAQGDVVTLTVTVSGNFANYEMSLGVEDGLSIKAIDGIQHSIAADKKSGLVAFSDYKNVASHSFTVTVNVDTATPGGYDLTATPTLSTEKVDPALDTTDGTVDGYVAVTTTAGSATLTIPTPVAPTATPAPTAAPTATPVPTCKHNFEGWATDSDNHWHKCTICGEIFDLGKHEWQWIVDKKATATETGRKHEACEICGLTRNVDTVIPKVEGLDDVPVTGDPTPYLALGAVAVLGLLTGAVLVFKRKTAK